MGETSDLWFEHDGERHCVVYIEYPDDHPGCVITHEHWDHSKKPWFNPAKDRATGIATAYFAFHWSDRYKQLYWHATGCSGGDRAICVSPMSENRRCKFWAASGVRYVRWQFEGEPLPLSEKDVSSFGYDRLPTPMKLETWNGETTLNPFEVAEGDTPCVYCPICKDDVPDEDSLLCEHLAYCERCCETVMLRGKQGHVSLDNTRGKIHRHTLRP